VSSACGSQQGKIATTALRLRPDLALPASSEFEAEDLPGQALRQHTGPSAVLAYWGLYDRAVGWGVYCAVAKTPRAGVPSGSRQVAERHGRPAWPARAALPAGRRIL
jgi:hypothetical protein